MSRPGEAWYPLLALALAGLLAAPARAQTIADYSRAQRALLESTMTQAAARSAGLGAAAPGAAEPASAVAGSPVPPARVSPPSLAPAPQVSGVFASSTGSVAEVVVNATAYVLAAGQGVPGTPWRVESIAIDRVVLSRREAGGVAAGAEGARQVFPLPALR